MAYAFVVLYDRYARVLRHHLDEPLAAPRYDEVNEGVLLKHLHYGGPVGHLYEADRGGRYAGRCGLEYRPREGWHKLSDQIQGRRGAEAGRGQGGDAGFRAVAGTGIHRMRPRD